MLENEECLQLLKELDIENPISVYEFINKIYLMGYEQSIKDYDNFQENGVLII